MVVFVKVRQVMQLRPEELEEADRMIEEWFQRFDSPTGRNAKTQSHKDRCDAALGDLRNLRAGIRWRLHRGDAPDMLL